MKAAEWMPMLEQLTAALNQSAAEVTRHEQALESPLLCDDLSDERHISWQRALERFSERLQDCQTHVTQAEQQTQEAESDLAQHEQELRRLLDQFQQIRQRLDAVP